MLKYIFAIFIFCSCMTKNEKNRDINPDLIKDQKPLNTFIKKDKKQNNNKSLDSLFTIKSKTGLYLGTVFGKKNSKNDNVFNEIILVNKKDTIYTIKDHIFRNKEGIDIEIRSENFFGYKVILSGLDYFVLQGLFNNGSEVSDDINLNWNYDKNLLEVMKMP